MGPLDVLLKVLDYANPVAGIAAEFVATKLGLTDSTIGAVKNAVSKMTDAPGDRVKLAEIESGLRDKLASYGLQLETVRANENVAVIQAVNETLQADARGDSWLQKNHHAIECLLTVCLIIAVYFVLPLARVPVPPIPETAFLMLAAVLGVSSWQRGEVNKTIAAGNTK